MRRRLPLAAWAGRQHRIGLAGLTLVVPVLALATASLYGEWSATISGIELPPALQAFLGEAKDYASPAGFLSAEFFSWVPAGLAVFAILWGTAAIAGDEEAGRLDLLLAQPVSRARVLAETSGALSLGLVVAALAAIPGLVGGLALSGVAVPVGRVVWATVATVPLLLVYLALALLCAALFSSRAAATAAATGLLVAGYFFNLLATGVDLLRAARPATPFYWGDASRALVGNPVWARVLVLLAVATVLWLLALLAFRRREIGSGQPPLKPRRSSA